MDLSFFLSLVGAIAGIVAAVTGVIVLMTLQPPYLQNTYVRKKTEELLFLNFSIATNFPNCRITKVSVKGMRVLMVSSSTEVALWKGQIPYERFSETCDSDVLLPPSCNPLSMCFALLPDLESAIPSSLDISLRWQWRFISWTISRSVIVK